MSNLTRAVIARRFFAQASPPTAAAAIVRDEIAVLVNRALAAAPTETADSGAQAAG